MSNLRRERFLKIAATRTNKIIEDIRLLGNCGNTNNYEYTDEEVKKIFHSIKESLFEAKARFEVKKKDRFKF
jgi:hypothetical protein